MSSRQEDARLALLAAYAFDMFPGSGVSLLEPPADPRLAPEWALRGYITACDAVLLDRLGLGPHVFYGILAESTASPGEFVAVVRGTADLIEWAIDAKFEQVPHPSGGHAEAGFYGIFQTMRFRTPGGQDSNVGPGIAAAVGQGSITVIGHSLGAAVATYLALDLAANQGLEGRLRARIFASPRPGDQAFADVFAQHIKDAVAYAYERDEVPEVPVGFGYLPLHCLQLITKLDSQALILDTVAAAHHIFCYAAELDYGLMPWPDVPLVDRTLTKCILGPGPAFPARNALWLAH